MRRSARSSSAPRQTVGDAPLYGAEAGISKLEAYFEETLKF
jgi:hypothetical protein